MKKRITICICFYLLFLLVLCSCVAEGNTSLGYTSFTVNKMTYSIPKTWYSEEGENHFFHFGKEKGSTDGGYLYVVFNEDYSSEMSNMNNTDANKIFKGMFNSMFESEGDVPYIKQYKEGYWCAMYSGNALGKLNGMYMNYWSCITSDGIYALIYSNTDVEHTTQDGEFNSIIKTISFDGYKKNDGDSFLFRNIPWFADESYVKECVEKISGIKRSWYLGEQENARIDSWFQPWQYMHADINVYDAGVILRYENAPVAGYDADLELSFAYPIIDEKIHYNKSESQFYMAIYSIRGIEDLTGAYRDLSEKLNNIYYEPKEIGYKDTESTLWIAKDNSLVWLAIRGDEVIITYAAPNTDDYLINLEKQIKQETIANEADKREENKENYDGL